MQLSGFAHVSLTVSDLPRSKAWYGEVLDWEPVMEGDDEGVVFSVGALPGGAVIAFRQYDDGSRDRFEPKRTGLDHVAFAANSEAELSDWETRLSRLDVDFDATQHTPYGHVLNFKDPDGIALELFAAP